MNVAKVVLALVLSFAGLAGTGQCLITAPFTETFDNGASWYLGNDFPRKYDSCWYNERFGSNNYFRAYLGFGLNTYGIGSNHQYRFFNDSVGPVGYSRNNWLKSYGHFPNTIFTMVLNSPPIFIQNMQNPELEFLYHSFGKDNEVLYVETKRLSDTVFTTIDSIKGSRHIYASDPFTYHRNTLMPFVNDTVIIQFRVVSTKGKPNSYALDNISVKEKQSCSLVNDVYLTSISADSARVNFSGGINQTVELRYGIVHSTVLNTGLKAIGTSGNLLLNNLKPGLFYDVIYRSICGQDSSIWSSPISFQQACIDTFNFPFNENFDDWVGDTAIRESFDLSRVAGRLSACWTNPFFRIQGAPYYISSNGADGTRSFNDGLPAKDHSGNGIFTGICKQRATGAYKEPELITPYINLNNTVNPELSFWCFNYRSNYNNKMLIYVEANGIWQKTDSVKGLLQTSINQPWQQQVFSLFAYKNKTIRVKFVVPSREASFAIDDFSIREKPGCALAGVDKTILLCDTASQIQNGRYSLSNLLDSNAVGGTWVDVSGSGALNGNLVALNQLLTDTLYRYQYQIPASVGCAADTMEVRLQLVASACLISLAEQINQSAIQVFPNPNKGIFNVEFGQAVHNPVFTLHQLSGKSLAVQAVKLSENAYQLSTKNIPVGVYFISIQGDKKEILARKKVVIGE